MSGTGKNTGHGVIKKLIEHRMVILSSSLTTAVAIFTTLPIHLETSGITWFDKLMHFLVFGLLALSFLGALIEIKKISGYVKMCIASSSLSLLFGGLIELVQYFIPGRRCSFYDFLADFLGILIFIVIFYIISGRGVNNTLSKGVL